MVEIQNNMDDQFANLNSIQIKAFFKKATEKKLKRSVNKKHFDNAYNKLKLEAKRLYGGNCSPPTPVLECLKNHLNDHKGSKFCGDISVFYLECESGNTTHTANNDFRRSTKGW